MVGYESSLYKCMGGVIAEYEQYLEEFHSENIINLLNENNDNLHVSIHINLDHLKQHRPNFFSIAIQDPWNEVLKWNAALLQAQKALIEDNKFLEPGFQIKQDCHIRFVNLNSSQNEFRLRDCRTNDYIGKFVQVKGTVVRITESKLVRFKRGYICNRCKELFTIEAHYNQMYIPGSLIFCKNTLGTCKGVLIQKEINLGECFLNYQEIQMQDLFGDKRNTTTFIVTLDNDLVNYCQPGELITVCGTIERRWEPILHAKRLESGTHMRAISVYKHEEKVQFGGNLCEQEILVCDQWQQIVSTIGPLNARDQLIKSICPIVHGMYLVKLAIALSICSGIESYHYDGTIIRGKSHLLLVGDPGLAKSQLLNAASEIAKPSIRTSGLGCSKAGITAAAIKEDGEWNLHAGALVLADGGICCIDEFNLMNKDDKSSIHEAMEQQTSGLVCQLKTRCAVIAATNPKNLYNMSEIEGTSSVNIGMGSALLSRFDIVLILRDGRDPDWDAKLANHILKNFDNFSSPDIWPVDRLQSHFLRAREIVPEMSAEATQILKAYFKICRLDAMRDVSRTSMRLLNSLNRLSEAHARLMLRTTVEPLDAIVAIRLMESSWGFGRILTPVDVVKEDLPLGPSENQIHEVLSILGLSSLQNSILRNLNKLENSLDKVQGDSSEIEVATIDNVDNLQKIPLDNSDFVLNANNLEQMFGFDINNKKMCRLIDKKDTSMECSDSGIESNNLSFINSEEGKNSSVECSESENTSNILSFINSEKGENSSVLCNSKNTTINCPENRITDNRNTNLNGNLNYEEQTEFEDFDMDENVISQIALLETQEAKKTGDIEKNSISDKTLAKLHQFKNPNYQYEGERNVKVGK